MNEILFQVQSFMDRANQEPVEVSEEVLDEFAASCRAAFKKQFTEKRQDKFTIRMSNIGKPLCQLQMEQAGTAQESLPYNHKMKMLMGDMVEAAAVAILKSAGVHVEAQSQHVTLEVGSHTIQGTYDVKINGKIWDIKSASAYAFSHKFSEGSFASLQADDSFGYVAQGFGYAEAAGCQFGGWIAIDKSTGEWSVSEVPEGSNYSTARYSSLDKITANIKALTQGQEFKRLFKDVEETYYNKPTGYRILPFNCSYCQFKQTCWPEAKQLPQINSKAQFPKLVYYTKTEKDI